MAVTSFKQVQEGGGQTDMGLEYLLTGLVALFVAVYLVVALLRPDKF